MFLNVPTAQEQHNLIRHFFDQRITSTLIALDEVQATAVVKSMAVLTAQPGAPGIPRRAGR
jgi:hypothetical protein